MSGIDIASLIGPEMAAALAKQKELAPGPVRWHDTPVEEVRASYIRERAFWNADGPELADVRDMSIEGPHGAIPVRLYRPSDEPGLGAVVYLHGGGWIVGNLDTHDKIMRVLAVRSGLAVVGVDYRLAPEHKFPVAHEEAVAATEHLMLHGRNWGLNPDRLAVAGDSAGANMSLATCLAFKQRGHGRLKAAALAYGAFGLRDSPSRRFYAGVEDGMSPEDLAYYVACLTRTPDDLADPRMNLLSNDLAGLPPTFIAAAELDPLHDDSIALARLLEAAGVPHRLEVYEGVLHGYLHLSRMVTAARRTLEDMAQWLAEALQPD